MAKKKGMSRRDFFRNGLLTSTGVFLGGFGGASLALLWPSLRGGFGSKIIVGRADDLKASLTAANGVMYFPEARSYLVDYAPAPGQEAFYDGLADGGFLAVYQKCAHLGCKVPHCVTSNWLECPCHGSRYNKAGEYMFGPAPTGLAHFPVTVDGENVVIDTAAPAVGPPRGTNTINQDPEGPHCVG